MPRPNDPNLYHSPPVEFAVTLPAPPKLEAAQKAADESILQKIVFALQGSDTETARTLATMLQHKDHIKLADETITTHEKANAKRTHAADWAKQQKGMVTK